jgi:hypothetical protein
MSSDGQSEVVKTAGERLQAIEAWSRRTFYATVIGASFLGIMASMTVFVAYVYLRVTMAVSEASAAISRGMDDSRGVASRPPSNPARSESKGGGLTFDPGRAVGDLRSRFETPSAENRKGAR